MYSIIMKKSENHYLHHSKEAAQIQSSVNVRPNINRRMIKTEKIEKDCSLPKTVWAPKTENVHDYDKCNEI